MNAIPAAAIADRVASKSSTTRPTTGRAPEERVIVLARRVDVDLAAVAGPEPDRRRLLDERLGAEQVAIQRHGRLERRLGRRPDAEEAEPLDHLVETSLAGAIRGAFDAQAVSSPIMGRHPDPRPGEDAAALSDEPVEPASRPRRSRLAGRLVAVGLTVLLGGWAAVAVAGAATTALAPPIAAAVPTPAVITPSPATSASAQATASTGPSPSASADAPGKPPSAPQPPAPAPDGSAMARPRLTTIPIGTRLQAQLDRLRARLGIPGVSATIVFRDGTSWTGVSGLADVAAQGPGRRRHRLRRRAASARPSPPP